MAKYADIEPFYEWLAELMRMDTSSYPDHQTLMFYEILDELDSLPEVVRCKDCKHWKLIDSLNPHWECQIFYGLHHYGYLTGADDFCSYGERKDNE